MPLMPRPNSGANGRVRREVSSSANDSVTPQVQSME
jgi:hypothetical protein